MIEERDLQGDAAHPEKGEKAGARVAGGGHLRGHGEARREADRVGADPAEDAIGARGRAPRAGELDRGAREEGVSSSSSAPMMT